MRTYWWVACCMTVMAVFLPSFAVGAPGEVLAEGDLLLGTPYVVGNCCWVGVMDGGNAFAAAVSFDSDVPVAVDVLDRSGLGWSVRVQAWRVVSDDVYGTTYETLETCHFDADAASSCMIPAGTDEIVVKATFGADLHVKVVAL